MKNVVIFVLVALLFVSCNNETKKEDQSQTETKEALSLDNDLLRSLSGKKNLQNSMDAIAYPWHCKQETTYKDMELARNEGLPTPEQPILIKEMDAERLKNVFHSLPADNEWKWLTQSQVVEFCLSNRNFIRKAKKDIVFFCKKDETKPIYARNLKENLFIVIIEKRDTFYDSCYRKIRIAINKIDDFRTDCLVIIPEKN